MKCVLHIGTEKTGTTLLQDWLYSNQAALSGQGIYLSDSIGKTNNRLFAACFQDRMDEWAKARGIASADQKDAYFDGFLDRLSAEIRAAAAGHHTFVITSEHLHSRVTSAEGIAAVRDFLQANFDQIKVVCYFRNQFDMVVSLYSTALKQGGETPVDNFVRIARPDNYYFNFLRIADNWSAAFGRQNCSFRIYDRARFANGDIRADFLGEVAAEAQASGLDFNVQSSNESLRFLQAAAFRAINHNLPFRDKDDGSVNRLNGAVKRRIQGIGSLKAGRITSAAQAHIDALFDDSNRAFFARYFQPCDGFTDAAAPDPGDQTFTLDQVGQIVGDLLDGLLPMVDAGSRLVGQDAADLRDIATRIETGDALSIADALSLMKLAQRARPDGRLIARKVEEYQARLRQKP